MLRRKRRDIMKKVNRREFLKTCASLAAAYGLTSCDSDTVPPVVKPEPVVMPTRPLGNTGFDVGLFSLGGQAALETPGQEDLSDEIINRALDLGVNYIDTSAYYGGSNNDQGLSERNIGRSTASRRDSVFLATKTLARGYDGAMRDLEQSLVNLQTDHVDLWQAHNIRTTWDWTAVISSGGAFEAFQQAKSEGTARFIGVSGHYDPVPLAAAMIGGELDTVLMALNAADVHYKSFITSALPLAVEKQLGIIAMKIPARGRLFAEGGVTTMEQALRYVLTLPISTAIIGCSTVEDVENNVELARNFTPYSEDEMRHLEDLTATYYREGAWFKYEW
jgi:aryl-alcohol dehydrogenase-like predicted oxidoreductase